MFTLANIRFTNNCFGGAFQRTACSTGVETICQEQRFTVDNDSKDIDKIRTTTSFMLKYYYQESGIPHKLFYLTVWLIARYFNEYLNIIGVAYKGGLLTHLCIKRYSWKIFKIFWFTISLRNCIKIRRWLSCQWDNILLTCSLLKTVQWKCLGAIYKTMLYKLYVHMYV